MSVYNGGAYLAEAVQSILDQTFDHFEFIIVNDGSTEPVEDILATFSDPRIRFVSQENMGLTRALNRGLILAEGEYVARMDADDVSVPTRLESQVRELASNQNIDLVGCFFDVVDNRGVLIEHKEPFVDPLYRLWRLQFHNNYGHGSVMLRKTAVIQAGMYDESLRYAQDYDLWSRLSTKSNTRMIPEALYRYRLVDTGEQASVRNYATQLATAIRISNRNIKLCNPKITDEDCGEIRALYWKFQVESVSRAGLLLLPATVEGFCRRFDLASDENSRLADQVAADAREQIDVSPRIHESERALLKEVFFC
jgi:glycosyltransferase involved in cell wall biosynthesis